MPKEKGEALLFGEKSDQAVRQTTNRIFTVDLNRMWASQSERGIQMRLRVETGFGFPAKPILIKKPARR
jgi:hypothetical protein